MEEFEQALEQIALPDLGQRYRRARGELIQRVLMRRVTCTHRSHSGAPRRGGA